MRRFRNIAAHDAAVQILVVLAGVGLYEAARFTIATDWQRATHNARDVLHVERALNLAWEQSIQRAFLAVPDVVRALNAFYFLGHFLLTGIFFVWLYRRSREGFSLYRDGFILATIFAIVIHWAFPTAPPRAAGVGLVDTLRVLSGVNIGSPEMPSSLSNPVAAVPSLHAGFAFGVALGLWRYGGPVARALALVYPIIVVLTIVVTGNHFVLDALAGIAVVVLGLWVAGRARRRFAARTALY